MTCVSKRLCTLSSSPSVHAALCNPISHFQSVCSKRGIARRWLHCRRLPHGFGRMAWRLILGIGAGWNQDEYTAYTYPTPSRRAGAMAIHNGTSARRHCGPLPSWIYGNSWSSKPVAHVVVAIPSSIHIGAWLRRIFQTVFGRARNWSPRAGIDRTT